MKKVSLLLFWGTIVLAANCSAQSSSWFWGTEAKPDSIYLSYFSNYSITCDANGNVYQSGGFAGYFLLDTFELSNSGIVEDPFIVKYNSNGNVLWARQGKIEHSAYGTDEYSMIVDGNGNSYLTGSFVDTIIFGPYILVGSLISPTMFLVKYDANGNVVWARQTGNTGTNGCEPGNTTIDKNGNIFITGTAVGTFNFGSATISAGNGSCFILKCDTGGSPIWFRPFTQNTISTRCGGSPTSIVTDSLNNIYITGSFIDTLTIGSTNLTASQVSSGWSDMFLTKLDSSGNAIWALQPIFASSNLGSNYMWPNSVVTDNAGNIYVTGTFADTVMFGSVILMSPENYNAFFNSSLYLLKFNSMGKIVWGKASSESDSVNDLFSKWMGYSLAVDNQNHIFLSGGNYNTLFLQDTLYFSNGTFPLVLDTLDYYSIVLELDTSGIIQCSSIASGGGFWQNGITVTPSGKFAFFGGRLSSPIGFGPDTLQTPSNGSLFVARWNPCVISGINTVQSFPIAKLYPNPNDGNFIIDIPDAIENTHIELYNLLGQKIYASYLNEGVNRINVPNLVQGMYIYRISNNKGEQLSSGKVIVD